MIESLAGEGFDVRVTQGFRTWRLQDSLYAQGRNGVGKIVTNAKGGESWHNFGLAVDVAPFDANHAPIWDVKQPVWARIIEVGQADGMVSGSCFHHMPDTPHFQMTGRFPISPNDEARKIFQTLGAQALWVESGIYKAGDQPPAAINSEVTQ